MRPSPTDIHASADVRIAVLAARQASSFSRAQALDLGITKSGIHRRLRSGRWKHPYAGVYTIGGSQSSWMQDVWCAFLAVGPQAVVTHETALHLHGLHNVSGRPITLTVPHGGHARLSGVFVHQIQDLFDRPDHITKVSGLPVSTVERTAVDLAASLRQVHLAKVVDDVVTSRSSSYPSIGRCLHEVMRPGKRGLGKLARVLDQRADGYVPPQSKLEVAFFALLKAAGLPEPRRQFPLPGRGAVEGLVDAAYVAVKVIVEIDGRRWHARIDALKRDHQRDTEAARAGWLTIRLMYEQIVHEPHEVCAALTEILDRRGYPGLAAA